MSSFVSWKQKVFQHPKLHKYFESQERLVTLIQELNKSLREDLGFRLCPARQACRWVLLGGMGMPTEVLNNAVLSFARSLKSTDAVKQFLGSTTRFRKRRGTFQVEGGL